MVCDVGETEIVKSPAPSVAEADLSGKDRERGVDLLANRVRSVVLIREISQGDEVRRPVTFSLQNPARASIRVA